MQTPQPRVEVDAFVQSDFPKVSFGQFPVLFSSKYFVSLFIAASRSHPPIANSRLDAFAYFVMI